MTSTTSNKVKKKADVGDFKADGQAFNPSDIVSFQSFGARFELSRWKISPPERILSILFRSAYMD